MPNLPDNIPENEVVLALLFELDSPPEPFEDDFPMIGLYAMFSLDGKIVVYIPEDDEIIEDDQTALEFIVRCAPLTHFKGASQVTINRSVE